MKVSYITMQFPGESETFAACDVRALIDAEVEVSVYCLRGARRGNQRMLMERGLETLALTHSTIHSILNGFLWGVLRPGLFIPFVYWVIKCSWRKPTHLAKSLALVPRALDIYAGIKKAKPDVVHLFWGHFPSLVGYLVSRHETEVVMSMFLGAYDLLTGFEGSWKVAQAAGVVWTHASCNVADLVAANIPLEKIRVCYRGIDMSKIELNNTNKQKRKIVVAGRLVKAKGIDVALHAFSEVLEEWPDASLVVLGEGVEQKSLEKLVFSLGIDQAVSFKGHVSHNAVFEEMMTSEVFLLMTEHQSERLPNVVKEAMACGCVCIVTKSPSIEELIEDGRTGFIVPKDSRFTAKRIKEVFSHPLQVEQMAECAYQHVNSKFNVKITMGQYCKVWRSLALTRNS